LPQPRAEDRVVVQVGGGAGAAHSDYSGWLALAAGGHAIASLLRTERGRAPGLSASCRGGGEPATCRESADVVPWEAHGMTRPQWSHTDGSALCPVPRPSGGHRLAQPQHPPGTRVAVTTTEPERAPPARHWQLEP
jgi:hypothetical protein